MLTSCVEPHLGGIEPLRKLRVRSLIREGKREMSQLMKESRACVHLISVMTTYICWREGNPAKSGGSVPARFCPLRTLYIQ